MGRVEEIMYNYFDNFLDEDMFSSLNKRMIWRFKPNLRQDNVIKKEAAVRIRTLSNNNDYTESAVLLGNMVPDIVSQIKNFLINKLNFIDPVANGIWFQYMSNKQMVGPHHDEGNIRGKKPNQCYSTFLYSHNIWEDNWGGELCFHTGQILPKKNRLIIYSREEEHWVNDIKHDIDDYQRMFLGVSWSTDNDF